jgi:MinD superfamily P-loop ATPase
MFSSVPVSRILRVASSLARATFIAIDRYSSSFAIWALFSYTSAMLYAVKIDFKKTVTGKVKLGKRLANYAQTNSMTSYSGAHKWQKLIVTMHTSRYSLGVQQSPSRRF